MNSLESPRPILATGTRGCVEFLLPTVLSRGMEVEGKEYIPNDGPAIIVINHMGWAEILPPMLIVPKQPIPVIKSETMHNNFLGMFAKAFHSIGIQRETSDREAMNLCVDALKENNILIVFPEGTRGKTYQEQHELKPALSGTMFMAKRAAMVMEKPVKISPWAIWGTENIFSRLEDKSTSLGERLAFTRSKIHVSIAPPFEIEPPTSKQFQETLEPGMNQIMLTIRDMLPEQYHGVYKGIPTPNNLSRKI